MASHHHLTEGTLPYRFYYLVVLLIQCLTHVLKLLLLGTPLHHLIYLNNALSDVATFEKLKIILS